MEDNASTVVVSREANVETPVSLGQGNDIRSVMELFQPKFTENMRSDFRKYSLGPELETNPNVKIVSKEDNEFYASREILSARSIVFRIIFEEEMKEPETGKYIVMKGLSCRTISVLLGFLYTAVLDNNWSELNVVKELVYAADKYMLEDLKTFLQQALPLVGFKETFAEVLVRMRLQMDYAVGVY